jgi:tRNA (guanine37-N1)-methyltransferase
MTISVLTIMPELFGSFLQAPVIDRAIRNGVLEVKIIDIREYAPGSFRHIDDSPFGGGAGMVMRCQPVLDALRSVRGSAESGSAVSSRSTIVAALSPAGRQFTQKQAHRLSELDHLILICGHYEGMDERIYRHVDEEISIGDYVLTGGEIAAMAVSDAVIRLLPGALRSESTSEESFENGLLEYPQYTQPAVYEGEAVPEVLLSGNHARIRHWRLKESLRRTLERRPDLLEGRQFTEEEIALIEEIKKDAP